MKQSQKPSEPPDPLLRVADVARRFDISSSLVYQLVEAGELPFHRIGNGRGTLRFDPDDITEYLKSRRISKTPVGKSALRLNLKHVHLKPR